MYTNKVWQYWFLFHLPDMLWFSLGLPEKTWFICAATLFFLFRRTAPPGPSCRWRSAARWKAGTIHMRKYQFGFHVPPWIHIRLGLLHLLALPMYVSMSASAKIRLASDRFPTFFFISIYCAEAETFCLCSILLFFFVVPGTLSLLPRAFDAWWLQRFALIKFCFRF